MTAFFALVDHSLVARMVFAITFMMIAVIIMVAFGPKRVTNKKRKVSLKKTLGFIMVITSVATGTLVAQLLGAHNNPSSSWWNIDMGIGLSMIIIGAILWDPFSLGSEGTTGRFKSKLLKFYQYLTDDDYIPDRGSPFNPR